MSLVDSSHIEPARRGRHGAHYKAIVNAAGEPRPGMIYKYEGAGEDGWDCGCGRTNWAFTAVCPICGTKRKPN